MGPLDMDGEPTFACPAGRMWLRSDGILQLRLNADVDVARQDLEAFMTWGLRWQPDGLVLLIDRRPAYSISFEAQQFMRTFGRIRAAALLVSSAVGYDIARMAATSFLQHVSTAIFEAEADATSWLQQAR